MTNLEDRSPAQGQAAAPITTTTEAIITEKTSEPAAAAEQATRLLEAPEVADEAVSPNGLTSEHRAKIVELAKLDKVEYDRSRKAAASELKLSLPLLDELVDGQRVKDTEESTLASPEPWPDPVDGD